MEVPTEKGSGGTMGWGKMAAPMEMETPSVHAPWRHKPGHLMQGRADFGYLFNNQFLGVGVVWNVK